MRLHCFSNIRRSGVKVVGRNFSESSSSLVDNARQLLDFRKKEDRASLHSSHFVELIKAYNSAPSPMWKESLQVLDEMRYEGHPPDVIAFNEVLVGLADAKRWQDSLSLLVEMRSRFDGSNTDTCYDVTTFNTAMRACALGGAPSEANELLSRMQSKETRKGGTTAGLQLSPPPPNIDSYNIAISAFAIAGWWERAMDLIADLRSPYSELRPNVESYNHIFFALQSAPLERRSFLARHMLRSMQSEAIEPNMVTISRAGIALRDQPFPSPRESASRSWRDIAGLYRRGVSSGLITVPKSTTTTIDMFNYSPPIVKVALSSWFLQLKQQQVKLSGDVTVRLNPSLENGVTFDTSRYVDWLRRSFLPPISASLTTCGGVWETDQSDISIHSSSLQHWIGSQLKK